MRGIINRIMVPAGGKGGRRFPARVPGMNGGILFLLMLIFCAGMSSPAAGGDIHTIRGYSLQYFRDNTGSVVFEDILRGGIEWNDIGPEHINFGYSPLNYWFRIPATEFKNPADEYYIEINNPRLDNVEFYIPTDTGYRPVITGDLYPFSTRDVEDRNFVFRINGNPAGRDIYFKLQTRGSFKFGIFIYTEQGYISRLNRELPLQWIYFGMLFLLVIYNLFLSLGIRDRSSLYFALFVLFMALIHLSINGFSIQYLWPHYGYWADISLITLITFIILFVCLYTLSFLDAMARFGGYYRLLRFTVICPAPCFFIMSLFFRVNEIYLIFLTLWVVYGVLAMMGLLFLGIMARIRAAWFLLSGFFLYFVGIILYALKDFRIIPYNSITEWSMQAGSGFMVILFAMGLIDRVGRLQRELSEKESRFRSYTENSPSAIFVMEEDGKARYANISSAEITGIPGRDFTGMSIRDMVIPEQASEWDLYFRSILESVPIRREFTLKRMDGERVHAIFAGLKTGTGVYLIFCTDITYRQSIEEELREQRNELQATMEELEAMNEEYEAQNETLEAAYAEMEQKELRLREIIEMAPYPIAIVDRGTEDMTFNVKFADLFGYDKLEQVVPERFWKSAFPDEASRSRAVSLWAGIRNELSVSGREFGPIEWDITTNDNLIRTVEARIVDLKEGFLIILYDITERRKTQEILIQNEKMMSLGGLAAGMAHEVNNPLGIVLQGIQVVMNRISPDKEANIAAAREEDTDIVRINRYLERRKVTTYLREISEAGNRAARIIANMLNFSRPGNGEKSPHSINDLLDNALAMASGDYDLRKKYDFRTINIVRDYAKDLPAVVCRGTEIEQVFLNLFKNSAQAMREWEEGAIQPEIRITTARDDTHVIVTVGDNGPGMTRDVMRHIFDPFYTTKSPGTGTGLGLSVSYFIITVNHGGTIEVESYPGHGAVFTIRLPYA